MKRMVDTPESVRDGLLAVTFDIFRNEERFWGFHALEEGRNERCWGPVDESLFVVPISLGNVTLSSTVEGPESIRKATVMVEDEMLTVEPGADPELYENEWARYMLDRFRDAYYSHRHSLCFRFRRAQAQAVANNKVARSLDTSTASLSHGMSSEFFRQEAS
jgi:hypothetical protein